MIELKIKPVDMSNKSWKNILGNLKPGDSFIAPLKLRNTIANCATVHYNNTGKALIKTTTKNQPKGKLLVWREK